MAPLTPARYTFSPGLPPLLAELGSSLLVSTYQAGQLCALGTDASQLHIELEPFALAMGIAIHPQRIAIGTRGTIWFLESAGRDLAQQLKPDGRYDAALLARTAHVTGNIHAHEMSFVGDELWIVNTLFSCLATLQPGCNFVPRWKPKFISSCYEPGDRCHLNGLAIEDGKIRYVTAMAETDTPNGWRIAKEKTGVLIDVEANEVVARGFAMPHSPRVHQGRLFALDSGRGQLVVVDRSTGQWEVVSAFPGYTRGLAFFGPWAFVGLSRIRETAVFGGLPIAAQRDELKCGVGVVDLRTGQQVAAFQFFSGVEEVFDVRLLPTIRCPAIRGPQPGEESNQEIWITPPPPPPAFSATRDEFHKSPTAPPPCLP